MAAISQWFEQDLQKPVLVNYSKSTAFTTDNNSLIVGVRIFNGGAAASLAGNVVCHVIRDADGGTVTFNGALSGNSVSATLPAACFAYPGPIAVMLQLVTGTVKTTLLKTVYNVAQGSTSTSVDPGSVVPNIDNLLAQIQRMEQATTAANSAAAGANASKQACDAAVAALPATLQGMFEDLGLTVQNGKLCAVYNVS